MTARAAWCLLAGGRVGGGGGGGGRAVRFPDVRGKENQDLETTRGSSSRDWLLFTKRRSFPPSYPAKRISQPPLQLPVAV